MKIQIIFMLVNLVSIMFSQVEMNYSYEMQYGNGQQVTGQNNLSKEGYTYIENLLDVNSYIGENIYVFTQLEYSSPPIYGYSRTSLDSMLTTFYIEFSNDKFNMKLGDQHELYGRGLGFYTLQNQNIDYDNGIPGVSMNYYLNENLKLSTLIGTGKYEFRSNPAYRQTDYQYDLNVGLGAIDYENQSFGYFHVMYLMQETLLTSDLIEEICVYEAYEVGEELNDRPGPCSDLGEDSDTINMKNYNLTWNYFLGPFDIYVDKSWIYHDKIHGEEVFGTRFYASLYAEILGTGVTYEYKNYFTPYLLKSFSNPPIVYREGNSILASRNTHSMNFGNEIGHQLDVNKNLSESINLVANLSISHRHQTGDMESIDFLDVLTMSDKDKVIYYQPFRQAYLEINGWTFSDRLYYKIGLDHFIEYTDGKDIVALTIPTQAVMEFNNGSSLTMYLEVQEKISPLGGVDIQYDNQYSSVSYSYNGKWIMTGFFEQEIKDGKSEQWIGSDLSWKINSETIMSIFYGSQKGGLVCANGICAEQPGFEDGVKCTFRTFF